MQVGEGRLQVVDHVLAYVMLLRVGHKCHSYLVVLLERRLFLRSGVVTQWTNVDHR